VTFFDDLSNATKQTGKLGTSEWAAIKRAFPGRAFDRWTDAWDRIGAASSEFELIKLFAAGTTATAEAHGADAALTAAQVAHALHKRIGAEVLKPFFASLPGVIVATKDVSSFRVWLKTIEEIAGLAPESTSLILKQSSAILTRLNVLAFRAWLLNGVRLAGGDPIRRYDYYTQTDVGTLTAFEHRIGDVTFGDAEKSVRAVLMALWRLRPAIRIASTRPGPGAPRRASFDGAFIQVPRLFASYRGPEATAHFHALATHVGAHLVHTREKFPRGTLKPIQLALVSVIEDARVETLAARDYPGLRRLWARFHAGQQGSALTAELLMMRLSRALADPAYVDDDPWVNKGRMMFFDNRSRWEDQSISRTIGSLLGNDIGQMRVQFNAKSYIVEPSYRDDNAGIWDFGDAAPEETPSAETILESVRINQKEDDDNPDRRERDDRNESQASKAAKLVAAPADHGIPIARHAEWDHISGILRPEWTTVLEFEPAPAASTTVDDILEKYADVEQRIARLVKATKVSRPSKLRRQPQGDRLDLDASIRAMIEKRSGFSPDPRIYETSEMRARDLSVLVLLDASESTRDRVKDTTMTVMALERAAAALLAQAMAELGDPFALHGFCSNGREEVRYYRVKDFTEPYTMATRARLAGLRGMLSTRLGAALRQAGHEIAGQPTHRKLVLVITDGEPADVDVADGRYLVEDARKAVHELSHQGINVFCVGLDGGGESYLPRIFGTRNSLMINRVEALPEKLPMLYFRLTM